MLGQVGKLFAILLALCLVLGGAGCIAYGFWVGIIMAVLNVLGGMGAGAAFLSGLGTFVGCVIGGVISLVIGLATGAAVADSL